MTDGGRPVDQLTCGVCDRPIDEDDLVFGVSSGGAEDHEPFHEYCLTGHVHALDLLLQAAVADVVPEHHLAPRWRRLAEEPTPADDLARAARRLNLRAFVAGRVR